MSSPLTTHPIGHAEARDIVIRVLAAAGRRDDDNLILAYIEQREAEAAAHDRRVSEMLDANNREVERRRAAEAALRIVLVRIGDTVAEHWLRRDFPVGAPEAEYYSGTLSDLIRAALAGTAEPGA